MDPSVAEDQSEWALQVLFVWMDVWNAMYLWWGCVSLCMVYESVIDFLLPL